MNREDVHRLIETPVILDYGLYLNVEKLLTCQKPLAAMCNADELQFQIVHQVEELWMKLAAYTLADIDGYLKQRNVNRVVTLFRRVHLILQLMTEQLSLLETMSPKEYQEIRLQLGNGSGQESPGFRTLLKLAPQLYKSFEAAYLEPEGLTVEAIYDSGYDHGDAYVVAEQLVEFDELFQKFRWDHLLLIHRSIGLGANSLKGRSVDLLRTGAQHRFYPALWDIRVEMTNRWGGEYGVKRPSLSEASGAGEEDGASIHPSMPPSSASLPGEGE